MGHTLILACGNPLRGDDGVAWEVVRTLRGTGLCSDMEIETVLQFMPEMAERVSEAAIVIFVDATVTQAPGTVRFERIFPSPLAPGIFTHELNPPALLALAKALYGRSPECAFALSVGAESLELREGLSEPVRAAIPEAVFTIVGCLARQVAVGVS